MFKTTLCDPKFEPKRTIVFTVAPLDEIPFKLEEKV